MTVLLVLLLICALAGLGFLGFHAFQWRVSLNHFEDQFATQQMQFDNDLKASRDRLVAGASKYNELVRKYNDDAKKWQASAIALKTEIQRLSKWKNVADAGAKAAEMVQMARATLARANSD